MKLEATLIGKKFSSSQIIACHVYYGEIGRVILHRYLIDREQYGAGRHGNQLLPHENYMQTDAFCLTVKFQPFHGD